MSHRSVGRDGSAGPEEAAGAKPPSSARTRREERRRLEQQLMQEHAGFVEAQSNNTGLQRSASNRKQVRQSVGFTALSQCDGSSWLVLSG